VLMMTISGLALFYGGLVRVQNVLATVMQSFAIACLITVLWIAVGYSLCFTEGSVVYGSYQRFWLTGLTLETRHPLNPLVSEPVYCLYELTFAIITPALIPGAFADRMRFGPMLIFIALWHLLVYCPVAHATWMTDGFLHKAGVLDFAGGNVVHIIAGFSGLVSSIVIGKRAGYGHEQFSAHNMLISVLGASLLWVGWMGFHRGLLGPRVVHRHRQAHRVRRGAVFGAQHAHLGARGISPLGRVVRLQRGVCGQPVAPRVDGGAQHERVGGNRLALVDVHRVGVAAPPLGPWDDFGRHCGAGDDHAGCGLREHHWGFLHWVDCWASGVLRGPAEAPFSLR